MSYKKTGLYRSFISVITVGAILALAVVLTGCSTPATTTEVVETQVVVPQEKVVEVATDKVVVETQVKDCLLYTSPSPRDRTRSRMPSSA